MPAFVTPWVSRVGATPGTKFKASEMGPAITLLDKLAAYHHNPVCSCDGGISWDPGTGTLAWSGTIRIVFVGSDGISYQNTIAAGNITLADNEYAHVTLVETNDQALTVSKSTLSTGVTAPHGPVAQYPLAYRNAASNNLYPVGLNIPIGSSGEVVVSVTFANPMSIDLSLGDVFDITMTGDATINFTGTTDGKNVVLRIKQDGIGSRVVTWGSMARFSADLPAPVLTTDANKLDYFAFRYNAAANKYDCMATNKGF